MALEMDAEDVAFEFAHHWFALEGALSVMLGRRARISDQPREVIVAGLNLYLDNKEDIDSLIYALRNGHGIDLRAEKALENKALSEDAKQVWRKAFAEQSEEKRKRASSPKQPKQKPVGFIYLMQNTRNDLTKIGFSKDPKYREKTLQSEEPEVRLLASWPGTLGDEESLHEQYKKFRVRGEWFGLTWAQIDDIKEGRPQ